MKGNNEIHLCEAAMIEAMQAWVDETMPDAGDVVAVRMDNDGHSPVFIVRITETPTVPKP